MTFGNIDPPPPPPPLQATQKVTTPHFAFPFSFGTGQRKASEVEQDSEDEIAACVELIVSVPLGSLQDQPDLGINDPTFTAMPDLLQIAAQINTWEPRAKVDLSALSNKTDVSLEDIVISVRRNV